MNNSCEKFPPKITCQQLYFKCALLHVTYMLISALFRTFKTIILKINSIATIICIYLLYCTAFLIRFHSKLKNKKISNNRLYNNLWMKNNFNWKNAWLLDYEQLQINLQWMYRLWTFTIKHTNPQIETRIWENNCFRKQIGWFDLCWISTVTFAHKNYPDWDLQLIVESKTWRTLHPTVISITAAHLRNRT